jgi:hypothetical protein
MVELGQDWGALEGPDRVLAKHTGSEKEQF